MVFLLKWLACTNTHFWDIVYEHFYTWKCHRQRLNVVVPPDFKKTHLPPPQLHIYMHLRTMASCICLYTSKCLLCPEAVATRSKQYCIGGGGVGWVSLGWGGVKTITAHCLTVNLFGCVYLLTPYMYAFTVILLKNKNVKIFVNYLVSHENFMNSNITLWNQSVMVDKADKFCTAGLQ